jgi:hypothetical protein
MIVIDNLTKDDILININTKEEYQFDGMFDEGYIYLKGKGLVKFETIIKDYRLKTKG